MFSPFSHDAEYTPEPASMLLLLAGSALLLGRKRQRNVRVAFYGRRLF
ncbi:MAG: PEP-CTERM sorting domain-containing protein [Candidatus Fervidibacter sp.]